MDPFKAKKLPYEYKINKNMLALLGEANERFGEYKTLLSTLEFEPRFFLDAILLSESYKSTQIEGTQVAQDEMYYLKYMKSSDDQLEIENLKRAISFGYEEIDKGREISLNLLNQMHVILLNSGRGSQKSPGKIRVTQNWIGPRGLGMEGAFFIPPKPADVQELLNNLFEYMNDEFVDPFFINLAISHAQFETIHPYKDGNGRLGRALIAIQLSNYMKEKPILLLSEILELYKPSYQHFLNESRRGNTTGFICFFLQCIIDQCVVNIGKINRIKQIYCEDMETIKKIRGNSVNRIMPVIMRQIVFTKKEVQDESGVSVNVVSKVIGQLENLGIVMKDSTFIKKGYRYNRIYNVFVNSQIY